MNYYGQKSNIISCWLSLLLNAQVFSVIPAEAGIQRSTQNRWIALKSFTSCPGLRSAAPGMTTFTRCRVQKT